MNIWLAAACGLGACLIPCADLCLRGSVERRLVGFELSSIIATLLLVLLTVGFRRLPFMNTGMSGSGDETPAR